MAKGKSFLPDHQYVMRPLIRFDLGSIPAAFIFAGGQNETVYSFRARARDSIGNEGSYPRQAQTETRVVLYPIARVTAFNPNITLPGGRL